MVSRSLRDCRGRKRSRKKTSPQDVGLIQRPGTAEEYQGANEHLTGHMPEI